ncbi:GerAB/ArcD/ProY family transporter [Paenibacillus chartarius]|uniref:GerAB/ArcD/ProY family transporter n=1 Tax=Paenibacillus chartarius TaxID=747481 RepID=A0ABV6DH71_9BACL
MTGPNTMSVPDRKFQFSASLMFFVIFENQVGVGIPGFQRIIFQEAGHDAWLCVLLAGLWAHATVWCMNKVLSRYSRSSLYDIHHDVYGRWAGGMLNIVYIGFNAFAVLVIVRNYVEMVQTWLFPDMPTWLLSVIMAAMTIYGVLGGVRVIVGVAVLSFIFTIWLILFIWFPLRYADWTKLLPLLEANPVQLWKGTVQMSFTIAGFEIFYMLYPYISKPKEAYRYVHFGIIGTTALYLIVMVVSLVYFSSGQLLRTIWATFTLFKIVLMPFLERFEYVAVSLWLLIVLPNLMLYSWAASKGLKKVFGWNQRSVLYAMFAAVVAAAMLFKTRFQIDKLNDTFGQICMWIVFVYPWVLLLAVWIRSKRKDGGGRAYGNMETTGIAAAFAAPDNGPDRLSPE